MEFNLEKAVEYYEREQSITDSAKKVCKELGIPYEEKYRHRVSRFVNSDKYTVNDVTPPSPIDHDIENDTETNQYETKDRFLTAVKSNGMVMDIEEWCSTYGIPFEQVKTFKLVTHTGKGAYYNIASHPMAGEGFENFYRELVEDLFNLPNSPQTLVRDSGSNVYSHLLIVDPADVHIGKLCDAFEGGLDYDSQTAVKLVKEGVQGILDKAKGFNIDKILFVGGNDILHIDTPTRTTTSGTPQDTDQMWYRNFLMAKQLYIDLLQQLIQIADVHFVFNPSNHDYTNGFFLADVIQTYFRDCENISFDCSIAHRKYFKYFENLIGTTHGDGGKAADLPLTMANESKDWSFCKHKYIYTHHVHHKNAKDYQGVAVESLRSITPADSWHHRNQFDNSIRAIEGYLHHPKYGQVARLTHIF